MHTIYSKSSYSTSFIDPLHLCNSEPILHSIGIHILYSISIISLQGLYPLAGPRAYAHYISPHKAHPSLTNCISTKLQPLQLLCMHTCFMQHIIYTVSCKALTLWLVWEHTNTIQDPIKCILSLIYYLSAKCWPISLSNNIHTHVSCNNVTPSLINVFLKLWPICWSDSIRIHTLCSVSIISLQIGPPAGPAG